MIKKTLDSKEAGIFIKKNFIKINFGHANKVLKDYTNFGTEFVMDYTEINKKDQELIAKGIEQIKKWCETKNYLVKNLYIEKRFSFYQMLFDIHNICDKLNLKYWTEGGTLLGTVRNKDMIPWDSDLDLGMMEEDFDKLCVFLNKNTHYVTRSHNTVIYSIPEKENSITKMFQETKSEKKTIYFTLDIGIISGFANLICPGSLCEYKIDEKCYYGGCHLISIDIFVYPKKKGDGFYNLNDPENGIYESKKHYNPGSYFNKDELFPLKEYPFGPIKILGPNNPIPYLERSYGDIDNPDKWKIPMNYYDKEHKLIDEVEIKNEEVKLEHPKTLVLNEFTTPPPKIIIYPFEEEKMGISYMYSNKENILFLISKRVGHKQIQYEVPFSKLWESFTAAKEIIKMILDETGYTIEDEKILSKLRLPISSRKKKNKLIIHHIPGKKSQ